MTALLGELFCIAIFNKWTTESKWKWKFETEVNRITKCHTNPLSCFYNDSMMVHIAEGNWRWLLEWLNVIIAPGSVAANRVMMLIAV